MSKFDKRMEKIFDVTPTESYIEESIIESTELQEYIPKSSELSTLLSHDLEQDYEKVRDNIDNLVQKGMEAIDDMLSIARESEKARDFEVASNMITQMVENSKNLLEIQKKMRDMTGQKDSGTTNIKNAVFVGSSAELLKVMKELKANDN